VGCGHATGLFVVREKPFSEEKKISSKLPKFKIHVEKGSGGGLTDRSFPKKIWHTLKFTNLFQVRNCLHLNLGLKFNVRNLEALGLEEKQDATMMQRFPSTVEEALWRLPHWAIMGLIFFVALTIKIVIGWMLCPKGRSSRSIPNEYKRRQRRASRKLRRQQRRKNREKSIELIGKTNDSSPRGVALRKRAAANSAGLGQRSQ
jgi:hypothetical protein